MALFGSGFLLSLPFDEKCKRADVIVRAELVRSSDLLTDAEWAAAKVNPTTTAINVFKVIAVAKGDPKSVPSFIFVTGRAAWVASMGEETPRFPSGADVVLFLRQIGDGFFTLLDPLAYEEIRDGKVVPIEARINPPKTEEEWKAVMRDAESIESLVRQIQEKQKPG